METEDIKKKQMKQTTKLVIICFVFLIVFIIVNTLLDACIKYFYHKGQEAAQQEWKVEQQEITLQGMNYNNGEGWYKNCKVKVFYNTDESEMNNFISNKDIVDIKTTAYRVLIIYLEPTLGEDIVIEAGKTNVY